MCAVYFKDAENLQVIPANVEDEGLKSAYEDADKHTWTKAELDAYDYVLMREQDERGRWSNALRRAAEKAAKEATEKATKETAKTTATDIALNLLKLGLSVDDIAQSTGLSLEEVRRL